MSKFFQWVQDVSKKLSGDPQSATFETRKTFLEGIAGIFGFILINSLVSKIRE
tara:strand:+ start:730 stop:888 length:159 start_codon:yes stop_codon:yes gene_type:complete